MREEQDSALAPQLQAAVTELQDLILGHYPAATFRVARGEDPEGIYVKATVDVEDTDEVMDLVVDRLLQAQIDEGLPLYVILLRPIEKVIQELQMPRVAKER